MRRIPSQVPSAVSRLLQASVLETPPTWYSPVLSHPPPQLPARQTKIRSRPSPSSPNGGGLFTDTAPISSAVLEKRDKQRRYKERKNGPMRIVYDEDRIRRQFFKDFAFEALRPISLVEGLDIDQRVKVDGEDWTRLDQRGAYPTVEDTISFVLNLRKIRQLPLSEAYATATAEFTTLRARHQLATAAAEIEARHYGAEFKPNAFEREYQLEEKSLDTNISSDIRSSESSRIKYREQPRWKWTNTVSHEAIPSGEYTHGQGYVEKWRMPKALPVVDGMGEGQGDLLAAIPSSSSSSSSSATENVENSGQDGLAFLQSVLSKSR